MKKMGDRVVEFGMQDRVVSATGDNEAVKK